LSPSWSALWLAVLLSIADISLPTLLSRRTVSSLTTKTLVWATAMPTMLVRPIISAPANARLRSFMALEPCIGAEAEGLGAVVFFLREDLREIEANRAEGGIPEDADAGAGAQARAIVDPVR